MIGQKMYEGKSIKEEVWDGFLVPRVRNKSVRVVLLELLHSVESLETHDESHLDDLPAELLDHLDDSLGGSAGRDKIIDNDDFLTGFDGIGVHLDGSCSVLELVVLGDDLSGEFSLLPDHDESLAHGVCDGCSEKETAGFGSNDDVEIYAFQSSDKSVDGQFQTLRVLDDRCDVSEHDPFLGEVGDGRYVVG